MNSITIILLLFGLLFGATASQALSTTSNSIEILTSTTTAITTLYSSEPMATVTVTAPASSRISDHRGITPDFTLPALSSEIATSTAPATSVCTGGGDVIYDCSPETEVTSSGAFQMTTTYSARVFHGSTFALSSSASIPSAPATSTTTPPSSSTLLSSSDVAVSAACVKWVIPHALWASSGLAWTFLQFLLA